MSDKRVAYMISLEDKFSSRLNHADKQTNRFNQSIGRSIGRFATFTAVVAGAGLVLKKEIGRMMDFEEQLSNLSAITGAAGKDLLYLKEKAIEMGGATTKSATDTLKAFKLIASAKPELLQNSRALASVTSEAITLSEASGMTLPDAATALADALNQFDLSANHSSRVINVLAAGAKYASAEIPDLTMSMKEFGGVASSMGISVEEGAAAIEAISGKIKGARAGIQFRNVLLKLSTGVDKFNPKVVGLSKALENLSSIQDDTTELEKMFNAQNILTAQTLIKNRKVYDKLTDSMTDTNTAYEQASINTDNLRGDVLLLSGAWERLSLTITTGESNLSGFLRRISQGAANTLQDIENLLLGPTGVGKKIGGKWYEDYMKFNQPKFKGDEEELAYLNKLISESSKYNKQFDKAIKAEREKGIFSKDKKRIEGWLKQWAIEAEVIKQARVRVEEILNPQAPLDIDGPTGVVADQLKDLETEITSGPPKVFNINIEKFVENFDISTETIEQGATEVRDTFTNMWVRMLADAQAIQRY